MRTNQHKDQQGDSNLQPAIPGPEPVRRDKPLSTRPRGSLLKAKLPRVGHPSRAPRLSGRNDISFSTCVRTLSNVTISRRGLLNLELAVGLAVFADFGVANRASKQMVADVYNRAGYDCETSESPDYKTVNRRIQASAALFGKLTPETISSWTSGKKESKYLQAIAHQISTLGFNSMDDVLDYVGRTSNRTAAAREPSPFDIEVGEGQIVHIPRSLTEAQLVELASKIIALAETVKEKEAEEAAAAIKAGAEAVPGGGFVERRKEPKAVHNERRGQTLH